MDYNLREKLQDSCDLGKAAAYLLRPKSLIVVLLAVIVVVMFLYIYGVIPAGAKAGYTSFKEGYGGSAGAVPGTLDNQAYFQGFTPMAGGSRSGFTQVAGDKREQFKRLSNEGVAAMPDDPADSQLLAKLNAITLQQQLANLGCDKSVDYSESPWGYGINTENPQLGWMSNPGPAQGRPAASTGTVLPDTQWSPSPTVEGMRKKRDGLSMDQVFVSAMTGQGQ